MELQRHLNRIKETRGRTVVDICCGAGMASLAFEWQGFEPVLGIDSWDLACESYDMNLGEGMSLQCDLRELKRLNFPGVHTVIMGPPCQDDSRIRTVPQKGRAILKFEALSLARRFKPRWIVMETVSRAYDAELKALGARCYRLRDSECGGFTLRSRWFYVWGPRLLRHLKPRRSPGWAAGIQQPRGHLRRESLLASESDSLTWSTWKVGAPKRWALARPTRGASRSILGGDRRMIVRTPGHTDRRLTIDESAQLMGFQGLGLAGNNRSGLTQAANGWTFAMGTTLAQMILNTEIGRCFTR